MSGMDAFGTTLSRGDGESTESFAAIANVTSISPASLSRDTYDVTAHDSTDGWREFIGGLKDGGEVSIDVNYNPGTHDTLITDLDDVDPRNYKIAFPDGAEWSFPAIMTGFEPDAPHDGKLTASLTFKVAGKPTFA